MMTKEEILDYVFEFITLNCPEEELIEMYRMIAKEAEERADFIEEGEEPF